LGVAFFGVAFGAIFVFFGFGAFGFFVGPALEVFFALEGDLGVAETAAAFAFVAVFFSDEAFLTFAGALFFSDDDFFTFPAPPTFLPALGLPVAFLTLVLASVLPLLGVDETALASLNEPDAPLPFVWTNTPEDTAVFKYFLINGATFSASTL